MLTHADILGPTGRIAARLDNYEHREEQLQMADAVTAALADGHHCVIEAGTGVGKSFAYLVPAILAATDQIDDEDRPIKRVVISTHTIALQEQLIGKDIPLLNSIIPREFSALLVKGRGNYLSQRRLHLALQRADNLFAQHEEIDQLQQLGNWANTTHDGSRSDLRFRPLGNVWDEVESDSGNCLGRNCSTYEQCFYYRARRRVQRAQVLVVNHALFFSDLALRRLNVSILPDYQAVIFDEAHTIESVAAERLGLSISAGQIEYVLNKLFNDRTNKGLLVHHEMQQAQQDVLNCHYQNDEFFDRLYQWHKEHPQANGRVRQPELVPNPLGPSLERLARTVRRLGDGLDDESCRQDFVAAHNRLTALSQGIQQWISQEVSHAVYWIEASPTRRHKPRVKLSAAPIDVGPALREHLFQEVPTVVMTSATLAVGRPPSFQFYRTRLGLSHTEEHRLGSPFDYRRQVKLILVKGLPDPGAQRADYDLACVAMIRRYVERTDGHAFVLFTSYGAMRRTTSQLTTWLTRNNLALYSQAEGLPRHKMLEQFRANPRSVLFGTDSFWQGVDVPGDALQNVIITKLPFAVPDHPLLQARLEAIRVEGGNPFMEYQVPEAVIKLRQGFGRLIRSKRDRGIVVILDPRVRTKPYGRMFLNSLPDCQIVEE